MFIHKKLGLRNIYVYVQIFIDLTICDILAFYFMHSIMDSAVKLRAIVRQQEPSGKLAESAFRRESRPLRMENKYPMISSQVH